MSPICQILVLVLLSTAVLGDGDAIESERTFGRPLNSFAHRLNQYLGSSLYPNNYGTYHGQGYYQPYSNHYGFGYNSHRPQYHRPGYPSHYGHYGYNGYF